MDNLFDQISKEEDPDQEPEIRPRARNNKIRHFTLTPRELARAKSEMAAGIEEAVGTLREAMRHAEYPAAIQAAKIYLDRAGLGPTSTLHLETGALKEIPKEKLAARALELLGDSPDGQKLIARLLRTNERTNERTNVEPKTDDPIKKTVH